MDRTTLGVHRVRFLSVVGLVVVTSGLVSFLFHTEPQVDIRVGGPSTFPASDDANFNVTIVVPAGQRLPMSHVSIAIENAAEAPPRLVTLARCWNVTDCASEPRTTLDGIPAIAQLARAADGSSPSVGPLWIRVAGYGYSPVVGYGAEIASVRRLDARDITTPGHGDAYGPGFGQADGPTTIRFVATLAPSALPAGHYRISALVNTGSRTMGEIGSVATPFTISG